MLRFLGSRNSKYYQARRFEELDQVLWESAVVESRTPQLIHLYLGELDCPAVLLKKARMGRERNANALAQSDREFRRRRNVVE